MPNAPLFTEDLSPWNDNANSIWLASTLLLHRNVDKFLFPGKLTADKRKHLVLFAAKEMARLKGFEAPILLKSEECSPTDKEFLVEHCLTQESFIQAAQGEAFFFDQKGDYLITVNVEDHLHFHSIDVKGEPEKSWNRLSQMETELGKAISYAYSDKFGFLTANPFQCGTGLLATFYLQLSALIHTGQLAAVLDGISDEAVTAVGLLGSAKEWVGDLVALQNRYSLGVNEENILSSLRQVSTKLIIEENALRSRLKTQENSELKDKVSRAYGLLIHSYQIETVEALNEIALLKLGVDLGWISGVTMKELNRLFFTCRRGHLLRKLSGKVGVEEVSHRRAEFIHAALKEIAIQI